MFRASCVVFCEVDIADFYRPELSREGLKRGSEDIVLSRCALFSGASRVPFYDRRGICDNSIKVRCCVCRRWAEISVFLLGRRSDQ